MSSMRLTARIVSQCEHCGRKFRQDPEVIAKTGMKDLYCCEECVRAAAPEYVCDACGAGTDPVKAAYGLPICASCQRIAFWSCWRKRIFYSSYEAEQWIKIYAATGLKSPLTPYKCDLCERWHASSWSVYEVASDEYNARIAAIAAVFRDEGFDIDEMRGYTNNPDGSHELDERWNADRLREAADQILRQGRTT